MPAAPWTSGSTTTAASSSAAFPNQMSSPSSMQVGSLEPGRTQHGESQWIEDVGAEAPSADRETPDSVPVVGVAEREVRGLALDTEVDPVLEGDLEGLLDGCGAVRGEQEVRVVDRDDLGKRLGQLDHDSVAVTRASS